MLLDFSYELACRVVMSRILERAACRVVISGWTTMLMIRFLGSGYVLAHSRFSCRTGVDTVHYLGLGAHFLGACSC